METADFMGEALKEARAALKANEVPVGCVVVAKGEIVARGHNLTNAKRDPLAHAELVALRHCTSTEDLTLYITCEPCIMCFGVLDRIRARVFYGCRNKTFGGVSILAPASAHTFVYCEDAVVLLRTFYLQENSNAPPEKRKSKSTRKLKFT